MPDSFSAARRGVTAHPKAAFAAIIRTLSELFRMALRAAAQTLTRDRPANDHGQRQNGDRSSSSSNSDSRSHRLRTDGQEGLLVDDIDLYSQNSFPLIEGWVSDRWREHLKLINDLQSSFKVTGHIRETGVFTANY